MTHNLQQHFVTPNISECVEVNAHSLFLTIVNLKKENLPQLLMPWKFSSQSCEGLFRLLRSASSTSSTQTNCSVRNFAVDKGRKIDVQCRSSHRATWCSGSMRGWLYNWACDRRASTLGLSGTHAINCNCTCTVLYTLYYISKAVMNSI